MSDAASRAPAACDPALILGGGLIGLAIAQRLARSGVAMQLLSRRHATPAAAGA
jgi:2-polyprenyl-6-methoxyphenol hydroxylase-like FAD-dependent oxidoreductase